MSLTSVLATLKTDLSKIEGVAVSDIGKFDAEFKKLWGEAPSALQIVMNFDSEVAALALPALALADPAVEPEASAALAVLQTALAGLQAAAVSANSGTSLLTAAQNFVTAIPATLSSIQVKNPQLQAKVEGIANFILGEAKIFLPAVQGWVAELAVKQAATPAPAEPAPEPAPAG